MSRDGRVSPMCLTCPARDADLVRSILDDRAALYLWLTAIPVGIFGMYAVGDFRMFIITWAAAGLASVVLADIRARPRRPTSR